MSDRSQHQVHHLGRLGELVPIILLNLLYQILTLGIYRFWAITNIRRYLWGRTLFNDDPLEYTGTGKELLLGFLLGALVVLVPLFGLQYAVSLATASGEAGIATALGGLYAVLILALTPIALYRARRYRLNRTVWRGIRWGQEGSAFVYALRSLGYAGLTGLTLGLAYPWQSVGLERYRTNHTYFGSQPLHFDGSAGSLFGRWLVVWGTMLGLVAASAFVAMALSVGHLAEPKMGMAIALGLVGVSLLAPGLALVAAVAAFCWYKAAELRYIAAHTQYQGLRFACTVTGRQLAWLVVGNMLLRVLTLGLGASYALVRTARLMARTLSAEGAIDFERVRQNADERTRTGEGLAAALNMGEF